VNISEALEPFGEVFRKWVCSWGSVFVGDFVWIVAVLVKPEPGVVEREESLGRERAWRMGSGTGDIIVFWLSPLVAIFLDLKSRKNGDGFVDD
jgi:hypothetical protein